MHVCCVHTSSAVCESPAVPRAGEAAWSRSAGWARPPGPPGGSPAEQLPRVHRCVGPSRGPGHVAHICRQGLFLVTEALDDQQGGSPGAWVRETSWVSVGVAAVITVTPRPPPTVPPLLEKRRQQASDHVAAKEAVQEPDDPGLQDAGGWLHQHGRGEGGWVAARPPSCAPRAASLQAPLPHAVPRTSCSARRGLPGVGGHMLGCVRGAAGSPF